MLGQLLAALGGGLQALDHNQRQTQAHDTAESDATKELYNTAKEAAKNGDWQWVQDNAGALRDRLHPVTLQSLISTTTLNNARIHDAEIADGGRPTIPLSPKNVYMRGSLQNTNGTIPTHDLRGLPGAQTPDALQHDPTKFSPLQSVMQTQMDPGQALPDTGVLQGIPNNEASLQVPNVSNLYRQPGMPQPVEAGAPPSAAPDEPTDPAEEKLTVGPMIQQLRDINSTLATVRDQYPPASPRNPTPSNPQTPDTIVPAKSELARIELPAPRRATSLTNEIGSLKVTHQASPQTSEGLTASALAQAKKNRLPLKAVYDALDEYNIKAAKLGVPGQKVDTTQIQSFQTDQFNHLMLTEQRRLMETGTLEPALAHQAAARYASQQLDGFFPPGYGDVVGYTPQERHDAQLNQALSMANMQINGAMKVMAATKNPTDLPPNTLYDIVDKMQGLGIEDKHKILIDSAQRLAAQLAPKLVEARLASPEMASMKAAQLAGDLTGGQVPQEWKQLLLRNPQAYGLSPDAAQLYMTNPDRYNVFTRRGMQALTAAQQDRAIVLDQLKAVSPEAAAEGLDAIKQQQSTSTALRNMGTKQRALEVTQAANKTTATTEAQETQQRKEAVKSSLPMIKDIADAMRDVQRTTEGAKAGLAYVPTTEAYKTTKLYTEKIDAFKNAIAKGLFAQSGNLTEREQKDAANAFADWWDARFKPEIAEKKLNTLNRLLSKHYGQRIDLNALDPANPDAVQPRVYNKQGREQKAGVPESAPPPQTAPSNSTNGPRVYDKQGKRVQ